MKITNVLKGITALGLAAALAACGSSGGGGAAPADTNTRTINGKLTGDLSNVGGVVAVRQSDSAKFTATVSTTARKNALTGASATFSVDVPVNDTYTVSVVDPNAQPIATVGFTANVNTNTVTTDIPVVDPGSTGDGDVDLGDIDLPEGTGDLEEDEVVEPENNPLEQVDQDGDGTDDFDDVDDDNDGVDDFDDADDNNDGIEEDAVDDSSDDASDDSGQDDGDSGDDAPDGDTDGKDSGKN